MEITTDYLFKVIGMLQVKLMVQEELIQKLNEGNPDAKKEKKVPLGK